MGTTNTTKGKGNNTPTPTPTTTPTPTPTVVFTPPTPTTPVTRKGTSTVPNPVGTVWVYCITQTLQGGGTLVLGTPGTLGTVTRKGLTQGVMGLGVTYYTARTQVNRYLGWVKGGCNPTQLPKGVVFTTQG